MAGRPNKVGLDYFELDCHIDEKVELIEAEFGLKGFAIIVKLYQSIYAGFGYYCEWNPDLSVLFARRLGLTSSVESGSVGNVYEECALPGFPKNLINEVISASIRRNIFSEELFRKYSILTSSGIQKRYLNATSKRGNVDMIKEYLLVNVDKNSINVVINSINVVINSINVVDNSQSKVKESKVKESKVKKEESVYFPNDEKLNQTFLDYIKMRKEIKKPMTERAVELAIVKLNKLATSPSGETIDNDIAIQILEQSILGGWQGLFALKEQNNKSQSDYVDKWRDV